MARYGCTFLFVVVLSWLVPAPSGAEPATGSFLESVDLLIAPREREAFLALAGEAERQAFIRRFWEVRDPYPETPRNELEERWTGALPEARRRWGTLEDERARVFLLQGEPSSSFEARCAGHSETLEFWVYEPRFRVKHRSVLVFRAADGGAPARLWRPGPDTPALSGLTAESCTQGDKVVKEARWVRLAGEEHYRLLAERALARPKPRPQDWVARFVPLSTGMSAGSAGDGGTFEAGLQVDVAGQHEERKVVRVLMTLPRESLAAAGAAQDLLLTGQVLHDRQVLDTFRYRFRVRPEAIDGQAVPLAFERYLLPGIYRLKIKLENLLSKRSFQDERDLAVPGIESARVELIEPAAAPVPGGAEAVRGEGPRASEVASLFAEAGASLAAREPGVRILPPPGAVVSGNVRLEARVDRVPGLPEERQIDRVSFLLDGRRVLTRTRPPYEVTLDLGPTPRPQTVKVEGMDRTGKVLAVDELALNAGAQRFSVRLLDPRPGREYRRSLRARAEVEAPAGETVERIELYLNEDLVATLYQPPYAQPIALPGRGAPAAYVRAVAYLAGGASTEDVVLLNAPDSPDALDVRLVELYTTVVDKTGRPVEGLGAGDFRVVEDGVKQQIRRLDRMTDVPVRIVALIDNSGSMRGRMEATRKAALGFLRRTLRPVDQAAVITFNQAPQVAVGLTGDIAELEEGFTGLVAEDQTSLYDSVVFSLHYLTGAKGQRAVLLLSDGVDRSSRFTFEQTLEYARRAGITVYAIGLDLPQGGEASAKLTRLAVETGGRSFFLKGTDQLDGVYQEIERELRSQYRVAYQSTNTSAEDAFRAVQVEVGQTGLDARTISGYYP
jgi:Ca-activated chloride channel family protein